MNKNYWELFRKTGLPEAYLLYRKDVDRTENNGDSAPCDGGGGE